jgi:hypothetical protein
MAAWKDCNPARLATKQRSLTFNEKLEKKNPEIPAIFAVSFDHPFFGHQSISSEISVSSYTSKIFFSDFTN